MSFTFIAPYWREKEKGATETEKVNPAVNNESYRGQSFWLVKALVHTVNAYAGQVLCIRWAYDLHIHHTTLHRLLR